MHNKKYTGNEINKINETEIVQKREILGTGLRAFLTKLH
jgi:hypothetical protein